jgi:hypothetical protein
MGRVALVRGAAPSLSLQQASASLLTGEHLFYSVEED